MKCFIIDHPVKILCLDHSYWELYREIAIMSYVISYKQGGMVKKLSRFAHAIIRLFSVIG